MIEKSTTNPPGILPTEVIADFVRFSSFRMELLEKKSSHSSQVKSKKKSKSKSKSKK